MYAKLYLMNTLMPKTRKQYGFTIVELLIVIVVIAVLAAVTVVAYTGISDRAAASKKLSIASQYAKMLEMYKLDNGSYPSSVADNADPETCLGGAQDYPAGDGYAAGDCLHSADNTYRVGSSTALNTALAKYATYPASTYPTTMLGSESWRGFRYAYFATSTKEARIEWIVKGNDTKLCGPANATIWASTGTVWCVMRLSPA